MSLLTDNLNQIRAWLQNNYLAGAEHIPSGLSHWQIEEIVQRLPFKLPQEVYELYQWSRGNSEKALTKHAFIFNGMALCSLERSMKIALNFEDEFEEIAVKYINKPLFPIFESEIIFLCVVGDSEEKESSAIIYVSEIREITIRYTNLTSMMLMLAECFETQAIYVPNAMSLPDWSNLLQYNNEKYSKIYRKHNSGLLKLALARLKQEIELNRFKSEVLVEIAVDNFSAQVWGLTRYWQSVEQFNSEDIGALMAARQDEDKLIRDSAERAFAILNGDF